MTLAVLTGVAHTVWAADPAAMATARLVLERLNKAQR